MYLSDEQSKQTNKTFIYKYFLNKYKENGCKLGYKHNVWRIKDVYEKNIIKKYKYKNISTVATIGI